EKTNRGKSKKERKNQATHRGDRKQKDKAKRSDRPIIRKQEDI
ncbi:unnamed protein product, partial [marine sediment metagenome]